MQSGAVSLAAWGPATQDPSETIDGLNKPIVLSDTSSCQIASAGPAKFQEIVDRRTPSTGSDLSLSHTASFTASESSISSDHVVTWDSKNDSYAHRCDQQSSSLSNCDFSSRILDAVAATPKVRHLRPKHDHTVTLRGEGVADAVAKVLLCVMGCTRGLSFKASVFNNNDVFDSAVVPSIPIETYLRRLYKHLRCSESVLVCALAVLDRFLECHATPRLTAKNVHRLFFTCVVLANKFAEDKTWRNAQFAQIGGIALEELNKYELLVFRKVGFKVAVRMEDYTRYWQALAAVTDPSLNVPADPCIRMAAMTQKWSKVQKMSQPVSGVWACFSGVTCGIPRSVVAS